MMTGYQMEWQATMKAAAEASWEVHGGSNAVGDTPTLAEHRVHAARIYGELVAMRCQLPAHPAGWAEAVLDDRPLGRQHAALLLAR